MNCTNCGAPLPISSDGMAGDCAYCQAGKVKTVDPVALSRSLERDIADIHKFVDKLAETLETGFASNTVIERSGIFSKKVSRIEVTLEDHVFRLETDGHKATTQRSRVVRGVAVKNETMSLQKWVNELSRSLAHAAEANAEGREALARFVP